MKPSVGCLDTPGAEKSAERRHALRGHDLMCWCPLGSPCHANVLLEMANR